MKVLCPTDFSCASVNALKYILSILNTEIDNELEIVNFVDYYKGGSLYVNVDKILAERAEENISNLEAKLKALFKNVKISSQVVIENPKTAIPIYAEKKSFNLICLGTTGLTEVKDMMVGSVTEYVARKTKIPILAVPQKSKYTGFDKVAIAIGKEEFNKPENLFYLYNFLKPLNPYIYLIQVLNRGSNVIAIDHRLEEYLIDLNYEFKVLDKEDSISETINEFCFEKDVDLLCLIHHQRNWFSRLMHHSIMKEELFVLEKPFLILPD